MSEFRLEIVITDGVGTVTEDVHSANAMNTTAMEIIANGYRRYDENTRQATFYPPHRIFSVKTSPFPER